MTKILSHGSLLDDEWQDFGDERIEVATSLIADEETLRSEGQGLAERGLKLALRVDGARMPEHYADLLSLLDMVVIHFPAMNDGRGFSSARELRERYDFSGTIRASGRFIPDQMGYLARVGFDAWELAEDGREQTFIRELRRFAGAYQRLPGDVALELVHRE
ncbi:MAG: DUF934 domain-containing protein [Myxococcota bacterium]